MGGQSDVGSGCAFLLGTFLVGAFFVGGLGDNYIVLGVELVEGGWILFIDEELFFEFELELILSVGFDVGDKGHSECSQDYCSSRPRSWLVMRAMGISPAQLSQEPTSLSPSMSRFEVILMVPSLLTGKNIFFGYT